MLIAWANEQDSWVRHAAAQIINGNAALTETQLNDLYEHYLAEKSLNEGEFEPAPELEIGDDAVGHEDVVELHCLCDVEGVNALAEKQSIDFDPSLTVLFGQNGAGKTGYARVLKRLAAVRTAEDILPNALSADAQSAPGAIIKYSLNGVATELAWANQSGVAPFTRMSIFDAPAVNLHVDSELNYVYTPSELALFTHVSSAVRFVQERLESDAKELRSSGNPFIAHFRRGTTVFPLIESIGPTTDLAELRDLVDSSEEGEERASLLATEVSALKSGNVESRQAAVKQESDRLIAFVRLLKVAGDFEPAAYNARLDSLRALELEQRKVRTELFAPDELLGEADDDWKSFIDQADRYREHLGLHDYPSAGSDCLYCGQELSPAALALVTKYRTVLDDALARQVESARRLFTEAKLNLQGLSLDVVGEQLRQAKELEPHPAYVSDVEGIYVDLTAVRDASENESVVVDQGLKARSETLKKSLESAKQAIQTSLEDLNRQVTDRVDVLASKEKELNQLVARRSLSRHMPAIVTYVENSKRSSRMDSLARAMSSALLRSLTNLSKLASEDLVNKNFQRLFDEECHALRAPTVALEFQGRKGRAERKKAVASYRPSAVLSEGEQKVLAIADFLAESRMSGVQAPIIFDDPVTSLDYLRLTEVTERISRLAETHQVVVFTHNIFFASTLLALRNNKKLRCKFYEVKGDEDEKGVILADVEPRQDTAAEIGKRINKLIETIGSADAVVKEALIESCYGQIRSWCEAFVEQELLQNVSQRFRVNVMMGGLQKINLDRFEATAKALVPIFDRCSRFMPGHSQPAEQLNVRPSLNDLKDDWQKAQQIRKDHIA